MADEKYCIVCGAGSHREDWINKFNSGGKLYVACDSHSQKEIQSAIQKDQLAVAEANKKKGVTPPTVAPTPAPTPAPATPSTAPVPTTTVVPK